MNKSMKQKISEMKNKIIPHSLKQKVVCLALFAAGGLAAGFAEKEHKAAEKYENQITQVLNTMGIKSIEDINSPDDLGRLPTMKTKSAAEMKLLIALGADVNATDEVGRNAINYILDNRWDVVDKKVTKTEEVEKLSFAQVVTYQDGSTKHITSNLERVGVDPQSIKRETVEVEYTDIERQHVRRNTNRAIQNDAECIALLLQVGVKIPTNYSDGKPMQYTDIQKEILEKAGNIAGVQDYVKDVLQITYSPDQVTRLRDKDMIVETVQGVRAVQSTAKLEATPKTIAFQPGMGIQVEHRQKPDSYKFKTKSKGKSR